ncbi:MAG: response regulator transcription factor [Chloroflexi bacterium]|nr:response regulator transcription factor [Chloroflexota bacterium]
MIRAFFTPSLRAVLFIFISLAILPDFVTARSYLWLKEGEIKKMKKVTVVAVDDHPLILQAIRSLVEQRDDVVLVGEGARGDDVLALMSQHNPDVLVLDLSMPQTTAEDSPNFRAMPKIATIRKQWPRTGVIILTMSNVPVFVYRMIEFGVASYILKSDDMSLELASAIKKVGAGGVYFSESIQRLLARQSDGSLVDLSAQQIELLTHYFRYPNDSSEDHAKVFGIKAATVRSHMSKSYAALGAANTSAAIIRCLELGIILR